jgi:hypothetical protein
MPIRIIKKGAQKQTPTGPIVANISADPETDNKALAGAIEVEDETLLAPSKSTQAKLCTFCKHRYIEPCHGKNENCPNAIYVKQKQASAAT